MDRRYMTLWIESAAIRALKTMAETLIGVLAASTVLSEVDWATAISAAVLSGIISMLWSIKGLPEIDYQQQLDSLIALDDTILGEETTGKEETRGEE